MKELNSAARDAYVAYSAAVDSRTEAYTVWDKYTAPCVDCENALMVYSAACRVTDATWKAYIVACEAARKAGDAFNANAFNANAFNANAFNANAYEAEVNKMNKVEELKDD